MDHHLISANHACHGTIAVEIKDVLSATEGFASPDEPRLCVVTRKNLVVEDSLTSIASHAWRFQARLLKISGLLLK